MIKQSVMLTVLQHYINIINIDEGASLELQSSVNNLTKLQLIKGGFTHDIRSEQ